MARDPRLDILEWACGDVEVREGERKLRLAAVDVNIVVKAEMVKEP